MVLNLIRCLGGYLETNSSYFIRQKISSCDYCMSSLCQDLELLLVTNQRYTINFMFQTYAC
jgi:hypothetical protein